MDWFTVALLIIFFVLPLVQQMLNKGQQPPPPEAEDLEERGVALEREPRRVKRPGQERESPEGGWAEGWAPWPDQEQEKARVPERVEPEPISWSPPEPMRDEEPYRMPEMPPVRDEQQYRTPEIEPLPELRPYEDGLELTRLGSDDPTPYVRPARPVKPRSLPAAGPARSHSRIHLRGGTRELKRAIVLKEILGPPTALRDPEQDRIW